MEIIYNDTLTEEMKSYINRSKYLSMSPRHRKIYRCKISELISEMSRVEIGHECGCITTERTIGFSDPYTSKLCDTHLKEVRYDIWIDERMQEIDEHVYEIRARYYAKFVKRSKDMSKHIVPIKYMYETLNITNSISYISGKQAEDFIVHKIGHRWHCCSNRVDLYADILIKEDKVCSKARRILMEKYEISTSYMYDSRRFLRPRYAERVRYIP